MKKVCCPNCNTYFDMLAVRDKNVIDEWNNGVSGEDIAKKYGLAKNSVRTILTKAKVSSKEFNGESKLNKKKKRQRIGVASEMAELFKAGFTLQEIGDEYSLTRERVRQLLKEIGVTGKDGGIRIKTRRNRKIFEEERNKRFIKEYGYTYEEKYRLCGKCTDNDSPHHKFSSQKKSAAYRGIGWNLTLKEWFNLWQESGKWDERGRGDGYVMARYNDTGAYEIGNVKIIHSIQNIIEYQERRQGKSFQETLDKNNIERVI